MVRFCTALYCTTVYMLSTPPFQCMLYFLFLHAFETVYDIFWCSFFVLVSSTMKSTDAEDKRLHVEALHSRGKPPPSQSQYCTYLTDIFQTIIISKIFLKLTTTPLKRIMKLKWKGYLYLKGSLY